MKFCETQLPDLPMHVLFPWHLCSGFAHGRLWAFLGVSNLALSPTDDPDIMMVKQTNDLARALYPTLAAVQLLMELLRVFEKRAGGPRSPDATDGLVRSSTLGP